jgi:hypothetical protein
MSGDMVHTCLSTSTYYVIFHKQATNKNIPVDVGPKLVLEATTAIVGWLIFNIVSRAPVLRTRISSSLRCSKSSSSTAYLSMSKNIILALYMMMSKTGACMS